MRLGVAILPYLMRKIEQGDVGLLKVVSYLTDGLVPEDRGKEFCLDWWRRNKESWLVSLSEVKKLPDGK